MDRESLLTELVENHAYRIECLRKALWRIGGEIAEKALEFDDGLREESHRYWHSLREG